MSQQIQSVSLEGLKDLNTFIIANLDGSKYLLVESISDHAHAAKLCEEIDFSKYKLTGVLFHNGYGYYGYMANCEKMTFDQYLEITGADLAPHSREIVNSSVATDSGCGGGGAEESCSDSGFLGEF